LSLIASTICAAVEPIEDLDRGLVDGAVGLAVELFGAPHDRQDVAQHPRIKQDRAEQAHLCLQRVRRQPIE
jgi:hypothetical protein